MGCTPWYHQNIVGSIIEVMSLSPTCVPGGKLKAESQALQILNGGRCFRQLMLGKQWLVDVSRNIQ